MNDAAIVGSQPAIDLNCDLGEDASEEGARREAAVLEFVSSINVACGLHAGDAHVMRRIMQAAARRGIAIGAHPSLADREHFGRRELPVTPEEAYELVSTGARKVMGLPEVAVEAGSPAGQPGQAGPS